MPPTVLTPRREQGDQHGALALDYLAFVLADCFDSSGRLSGTDHLRQQL
jgi:hypothetical protein